MIKMILSHEHKFIFFCNGKVASTSMQAALAAFQEEPELDIAVEGLFTKGHIPPEALKQKIPDSVWREYFKFCFVRNPWDWVVSQYYYNFPNTAPKQLLQNDILKLYYYLRQYR